jgi:NtrC-family two-component system sensor histidine kinase KinB
VKIGLRGRFLLAGALILATSTASSAWSALAFRRVSSVMDATLRDSEQTTAAMEALASNLEREDDALLLTLTDESRGRLDLADRRDAVELALSRIDRLPFSPDEQDIVAELRHDVESYHSAGDALLSGERDAGARIRYHENVNPLLRHAVSRAARVRDDHFRSTQDVAAWARDQASRATQILIGVFAAALLISILVGFYLARVVVLPVGELTRAVDALRKGDFERRVTVDRQDELGRLEEGFNRMADDLAEFRRANIGEVIRAKETLEVTLAALPDAVVVIEAGGEVSSANPRASDVMRAARGAPARHLRDLPLPEQARTAIEASLRGENPTLPLDLSKAMTLTVGTDRRRLLPRIIPIESLVGGRRGAVLLLSDVTELVRLDEMRMELVAVASHELRTPLTTLRMTLLMLKERAARLDSSDRELLATALLGVDQLATTVGEFLDLTRIEAGQLRLVLDRLDLARWLERALDTMKPAADDAQVELRLEVRNSLPVINGDVARLGVVLSNILNNALKYAPAGSAVDVVAEPVGTPVTAVRISVMDRGRGVPEEFRERIFDKFFRVEHYRPDSEEGVRGSGIGLYIAREIVAAHGGSIGYEPRARGRGASFFFVLPVTQA